MVHHYFLSHNAVAPGDSLFVNLLNSLHLPKLFTTDTFCLSNANNTISNWKYLQCYLNVKLNKKHMAVSKNIYFVSCVVKENLNVSP